jgi:hypothetical protein
MLHRTKFKMFAKPQQKLFLITFLSCAIPALIARVSNQHTFARQQTS